jgi:uncharacterized membrane-anchored protein YhcB (DUF1043 family)
MVALSVLVDNREMLKQLHQDYNDLVRRMAEALGYVGGDKPLYTQITEMIVLVRDYRLRYLNSIK